MIKYFQGVFRLIKNRTAIKDCQDIYFLEGVLKIFMQAEGKRFIFEKTSKYVIPKPLGKPFIISKLPQFSESICQQIHNIRTFHDLKIPKAECLKECTHALPEIRKFVFSYTHNDDFFKKNIALFLTFPDYIPEIDFINE